MNACKIETKEILKSKDRKICATFISFKQEVNMVIQIELLTMNYELMNEEFICFLLKTTIEN